VGIMAEVGAGGADSKRSSGGGGTSRLVEAGVLIIDFPASTSVSTSAWLLPTSGSIPAPRAGSVWSSPIVVSSGAGGISSVSSGRGPSISKRPGLGRPRQSRSKWMIRARMVRSRIRGRTWLRLMLAFSWRSRVMPTISIAWSGDIIVRIANNQSYVSSPKPHLM
jgi:hypothetical protein